ncbi:tricalbin [Martiniozyma asiatica (nom. inval.)]|nr:tricalbin [Martiniozyma asiatica]
MTETVTRSVSTTPPPELSEINLTAPVSKSIGKNLREKLNEKENNKRKYHPASFRGWEELTGHEAKDDLNQNDEIMDLLTRATTLEQYLPEMMYGDWFHGVGAIVVACFLCSLIGKFKISVGRTFLITILTAFYYRTSIRKYRLNLRLEAQREFSVTAIEDDFETVDWLNVFLDKYWRYLEPSISEQICDQVNVMLADLDTIPAFIKEIWIHTLTLGTKPFRVDKVRTLDRTDDDVTVLDWWISMTPNAMEDSTVKQMKNKTNQKVIIRMKLFGLTIPVCVSNVSFKAKVRVRVRMMTKFPHIQTINVSLTEQPYIDFMAMPISFGSIFSWEIFNIPGSYLLLNEMIKKYAGPLLFSPLSFQLNVEQMLAGNGVNGALGILEIQVKNATNLAGADTFNNTIDPYFTFGFSNSILGKTKIVPDTTDPVYNETIRLILSSSSDPLAIKLWDENESDGRKDKFMGASLFDLDELMSKGCLTDVSIPILRNNKEAGKFNFNIKLMKSLQGSKLPDGSFSPPPDYNTGVLKLSLLGARGFSKDEEKPESVFCDVYISGEKSFTSPVSKKLAHANWNNNFEKIIYDRSQTSVRLLIREASKDKNIIGSATLRLIDVIDASYVGNSWFPMNNGIGEVKLSCIWNSVKIPGIKGSVGYTDPIGIVRIYIENAESLLNLERFGVIDPYVRVMVNGIQKGRTLTKSSTTEPIFNESIYVPVSSINQRITIEALDVERNTQDRTLGSLECRLNEFVDYNSNGEPVETVGETKEGKLFHKTKGAKGVIHYSLSFYPCGSVATPTEVKEAEAIAAKNKKEFEVKVKECKTNSEKNDIEMLELEDTKPKKPLSIDDALECNTGVLVYTISDVKCEENNYFQIFFDKYAYASSEAYIDRRSKVSFVSDYLVKELEYSEVAFRIVKKKNADLLQDCKSIVTMKTSELIKKAYDNTCTIQVGPATISLSVKYIPVYLENLPFADSIGNQGKLTVTVLNGESLPAADSNGKSDPFTKCYLNGSEVYKTKTKKKTLEPQWNESFEVPIDSRVQSYFRFKVMDWDIGVEQDDKLGENIYSLKKLDPFAASGEDVKLPLVSDDGEPAGSINLHFKFTPSYHTIASASKPIPNPANLAVDGAGKLIGTGVDGAGKIFGTAGKLGTKITGHTVGKLFKKK